MSRLTQGLNNLAAQRMPRSRPELVCSFCGTWPGEVVGPNARICEQCAVVAAGMFLISHRDNLTFDEHYKLIFNRACSDYSLHEGEEPRIAKAVKG